MNPTPLLLGRRFLCHIAARILGVSHGMAVGYQPAVHVERAEKAGPQEPLVYVSVGLKAAGDRVPADPRPERLRV